MIVCVAPTIGDGLKAIRLAIVLGIAHSCHFATLRDVERFVLVGEAKDLIESGRKQLKVGIRLFFVDSVDQVNFTMSGSDRHPIIWQNRKCPRLDHRIFGKRHVHDRIVFSFTLLCAPTLSDFFAATQVQVENKGCQKNTVKADSIIS